jgi:hypothetical protein
VPRLRPDTDSGTDSRRGDAGIADAEGAADWPRFAAAVAAAQTATAEEKDDVRLREYQALRALSDARDELKQLRDDLTEAGRRASNVPR